MSEEIKAEKKTPDQLLHVMQDKFLRDYCDDQEKNIFSAWESFANACQKSRVNAYVVVRWCVAYKVNDKRENFSSLLSDYDRSQIIEEKTKELFEKLRGIQAMAIASGIPENELPWYNGDEA